MNYTSGGTYAICDVCGFQCRLREMKKRWDGLMVCEADWDPRPREHSPPRVKPEGVPLPNARPDNQTDNTPNTTVASDL